MPESTRHYFRVLLAFAVSFVVIVLSFALAQGSRTTHEFPEPGQMFVFRLLAGGYLFFINFLGFALAFGPVLWQRHAFPAPSLSGTAAGLVTCVLASTGISTLIGVPHPVGSLVAGAFVAFCLTLLSLAAMLVRRLIPERA